ncbi:unnamed protein product [Bursaphelenchus okinawaensis]|uniref:Activin_recp domain-containing protein n=1 Tax=Bursaphelenchus okinawaensis TaxID=465554 RepID=A0A811KS29_9BILA|nr:unnamed protein product [Bursaphelenchus okinawaensis]CAG9109236.1 unnamed protein product [Bursaphelenchus okinawaensis]
MTLIALLNFSYVQSSSDEIKCFCDKLTCPGSLVCTGKWCLIGISNDGGNGRLDQLCGWDEKDRPVDCAKDFDRWTEVCACDAPLCNTFAHLRSNMDQHRDNDYEMSRYGAGAKGREYTKSGSNSRGWYQGSNLIVLLVILPLAVGGMAVCLVFVNYHCKMT